MKRLFLSGLVAFGIELCIFALLFTALLPRAKKQYIFQDKTALEFIQIDQIQKNQPKEPQKSIQTPPKKIEKMPPKPIERKQDSQSQEAKPKPATKVGSDIKKLFEKIDSPNPPIREERIEDERPTFSANTIRKQEYSFKQDNSQIKKETSKIQEALDSLWENELEITPNPQIQDVAKGEYDEWFAKIKEILYSKWTNSFYESVSIFVNVVIGADGSFRYRIIKYSKNQSYNTYMENLLESLKQESFPPSPKGRITLDVTFKTKENNDD